MKVNKIKKPHRTYTYGIPLTNKNSFYVIFPRFPTNEDWQQIKKYINVFGECFVKPKRDCLNSPHSPLN